MFCKLDGLDLKAKNNIISIKSNFNLTLNSRFISIVRDAAKGSTI